MIINNSLSTTEVSGTKTKQEGILQIYPKYTIQDKCYPDGNGNLVVVRGDLMVVCPDFEGSNVETVLGYSQVFYRCTRLVVELNGSGDRSSEVVSAVS